jgi:hypothetical protein
MVPVDGIVHACSKWDKRLVEFLFWEKWDLFAGQVCPFTSIRFHGQ